MITANDESRPHAKGGSRIHCETSSVSTGPDLTENLARAARLVRLLEDQQRAERMAYEKGWRECGDALAQLAAAEYERGWDEGRAVGYYRATVEADERWTEVARQAHSLSSPESKTFEQLSALRAGIPWSLVKDWPVTGGYGITEAEWLEYREFVKLRTQAKQVAA